jgi:hypothetical protein
MFRNKALFGQIAHIKVIMSISHLLCGKTKRLPEAPHRALSIRDMLDIEHKVAIVPAKTLRICAGQGLAIARRIRPNAVTTAIEASWTCVHSLQCVSSGYFAQFSASHSAWRWHCASGFTSAVR